VEDQGIPLMSAYLEQVVVRGNRLATFAERARTSGSADSSTERGESTPASG
jgi:hypothetical protein